MQEDVDFMGEASESLFGIDKDIVPYYNTVKYGQLEVEAAGKEGKAATLLADAIFNSSLVMCEQIECGKVDIRECRVLELGAGAALPSLYSVLKGAKEVVCTDYPDSTIIDPIIRNCERNLTNEMSNKIIIKGHIWGENPEELLLTGNDHDLSPKLFDKILLCDLLWLKDEHYNILTTCQTCLSQNGRIHIICGDHTKSHVAEKFFETAEVEFKFKWKQLRLEDKWIGKEPLNLKNLDDRKNSVWAYEMWW